MATKKMQAVFVRAYSGVFFGYLKAKRSVASGIEVDMVRSRHVWQWTSEGLPRKALTVEDLAILGVGSTSRLSGEVTQTIADVKTIVQVEASIAKAIFAMP